MSKRRVVGNQLSNPVTRSALSTHAVEREAIKTAFVNALLGSCSECRMWLWGSERKGTTDDLSDLDFWIACPPALVTQMLESAASACSAAGSVVWCETNERNAPPEGGYLMALLEGSHGLHHLDVYWQDEAKVETWPETFLQSEPVPLPERTGGREDLLALSRQPVPRGIAFVWLMTSITAKYLARDPESGVDLLRYCRPSFEECANALGLPELTEQMRWEADSTRASIEVLRTLVASTAKLEDEARAQGLAIPCAAQQCLIEYVALVGQITT